MILADTMVWIRHLQNGDPRLVGMLSKSLIVTSDVVIGELLLGSGIPREVTTLLMALPVLPSPTAVQTREFMDRHRSAFYGSGAGWADSQIIVSAVTAGARVYSLDGDIRRVWKALGYPLLRGI